MAAKDENTDRDARLKAALRDNLKRRKQASRKTRDQAAPDENNPSAGKE